MRADRLLAILLLLQARGRMNARQLASELEVSERTIYRDITALSSAGVPVYREAGYGGGFSLVESYRTQLTGLSEAEARALFMLSIPTSLADLGLLQELKSALLKLSAALPETQREAERRIRQRVYLDSAPWQSQPESLPHLRTLYQAAWEDRRVLIREQTWFAGDLEWRIDPLGLVAKAGAWHLVYARSGRLHVRRVAQITAAQITPDRFKRPPDFDLQEFWQAWCRAYESHQSAFKACLRVSDSARSSLVRLFGNQAETALASAKVPDSDGWQTIELAFESFEAARERILSLGRAVEVLEPLPLRFSVLDYAEQIVALYAKSL